jgi:hypothetical protein
LTYEDRADRFLPEKSLESVIIDTVPDSFSPTHARFKARSLEWFRINYELSKSDWVLHLDEETHIDQYAIGKYLDFIQFTTDEKLLLV